MARYGIAINSERCMACYNCFMACKDEHCGEENLPIAAAQPHMGQFWMDIRERERGNDCRKIKTETIPTPCSHCQDAPCMKVGPEGAVYKRPDGIVIIDPEIAKGHKEIVEACPIGAIYWNEALQLPQKCTMCAHLLDAGYKEPRCVEACPNQALIFGDLDDPESEIVRTIASGRVTQLDALKGLETNVVHLNVPTVFLAGTVFLPDDEVAIGAGITLRGESGNYTTATTNDFGDWEAEWLNKGERYEIQIEKSGYRPVKVSALADIDRFVGVVLLEKA